MTAIDWVFFAVPAAVVLGFGVYAQRFVRTTADFLVANRTGGRYLLTASIGIAGVGVITFVAGLESYSQAGWALSWWGNLGIPVGVLLALTGFVFYRYRQTRAMTMAQFFEIRYGRNYRIVMGFICFLGGVLNFGIFPAVTTQFFMVFLGLPEYWQGIALYPVLMLGFVFVAALIAISGGQIQNMVTDTVQALFAYVFCIVIAVAVLLLFRLDDIKSVMVSAEQGYSFVNPFNSARVKDFNIYLILMMILVNIYTCGAFQGSQGYAGAAITPHESKMGGILNTWRALSQTLFLAVIGLCALTYWKLHPELQFLDFQGQLSTAPKDAMVGSIAAFLPAGIKGMFLALMFFYMLSTDTAYMHSWGVIFVQDVLLPIHGKPVSPRMHLLLLRLSIAMVALFAVVFSLLYFQNDFIQMFLVATGAFFTAAGGCAIIGGLYWPRGNKYGAWAALAVGVALSTVNLFLLDKRGWTLARNILIDCFGSQPLWYEAIDKCPVNGAWLGFAAMMGALATYVLVSLLAPVKPCDMDRLLHRKQYAVAEDAGPAVDENADIPRWKRFFLGFDHEFTRSDKIVSVSVFGWTVFWFGAFAVITVWNLAGYLIPNSLLRPWSNEDWFRYMMFMLAVQLVLAPVTAAWMAWGGIRDLVKMFNILKSRRHDTDDGFVAGED